MERIKCPYCGESIPATAKKCRFCGEWLTTDAPKPTAQSTAPAPTPAQAQPVSPAPAAHREIHHGFGVAAGFFKTYFMDSFLKPYANFSGYMSLKEFWLTYLALCIISIGATGLSLILMGLAGVVAGSVLCVLFGLAVLVPGIAMCCRRLRDAGYSPWMYLIVLVPGIGSLALLVMFCLPSKQPHEESQVKFTPVDWAVTAGCVVLLGLGCWLSIKGLAGESSSDSGYDLGDDYAVEEVGYDDGDVVEVEEYDDYDTEVVAVEEAVEEAVYSGY